MAIELSQGQVSVLIRQSAFERLGMVRSAIDARYNLTDAEFRVENGLVILGPLASEDMLSAMIEDFEASGLVYFDDFFEFSGNWPDWVSLYVRGASGRST
jgi:hypothetical protein